MHFRRIGISGTMMLIMSLVSVFSPARAASAERVLFRNGPVVLVGDLHLPPDFDGTRKYPAIVSVHPAGAVKEQTSGLYAVRLAQKGFVALAFDGSNVGESGGEPRYAEDPFTRMEDIHCAVDYLTTLPFVDEEKIGALGICAGGGYVMGVTPTERRIKAAAGVSTADIGSTNRDGWTGGASRESQIRKLEAVAAQRTREARGGERLYHPIAPDSLAGVDASAFANPALRDLERGEDARSTFPQSFVEAWEYYRTPRGAHPRSVNRMLFVSGDKKMLFSAVNACTPLFTQPALFIVGEKADSRRHSRNIHDAIPGSNKEIFIVPGATHVDMYDREPYVSQAVEKLSDFYQKALTGHIRRPSGERAP